MRVSVLRAQISRHSRPASPVLSHFPLYAHFFATRVASSRVAASSSFPFSPSHRDTVNPLRGPRGKDFVEGFPERAHDERTPLSSRPSSSFEYSRFPRARFCKSFPFLGDDNRVVILGPCFLTGYQNGSIDQRIISTTKTKPSSFSRRGGKKSNKAATTVLVWGGASFVAALSRRVVRFFMATESSVKSGSRQKEGKIEGLEENSNSALLNDFGKREDDARRCRRNQPFERRVVVVVASFFSSSRGIDWRHARGNALRRRRRRRRLFFGHATFLAAADRRRRRTSARRRSSASFEANTRRRFSTRTWEKRFLTTTKKTKKEE